jgi:universal stress protein A
MELRFTKVLVSTDFSEAGDKAVPFAFRLAKDHGASVVLAHVVDAMPVPSPLYAHYYPIPTPEQISGAQESARKALRERIPASYRDAVASEVAVGQGDPARELLRIAAEQNASVFVISTHGRTGVKHLLLGSVAEKVIRHATCPVLVIR